MYQIYYYAGLFGLSFLLTLVFIMRWQKLFQVHMTAIFLLIPITNLGYWLMYESHDPGSAMALIKIIYICGGCFLPWLITMCELQLCRIRGGRLLRMGPLIFGAAVYMTVLSVGHAPLFYKSLAFVHTGTSWVQQKIYGPFHTLHYIFVALYLAADLGIIVYSYIRRRQVSRRILLLLVIPVLFSVASYFANRFLMGTGYEPLPLSYVLAQGVYLLIARRMAYYSVSEMVIASMVQSGDTGFITVDSAGCYLGSNETAKKILPELCHLFVDQPIGKAGGLKETVNAWLNEFRQDPGSDRFLYSSAGADEKIYTVTVGYLFDGKRMCGYQVLLQDDTQNQKYIRLLDQYNTDLQAEVAQKTERIVTMHDQLVLGMAAMVDSRDNSTGGHIKRTSEGVRILVEAIREGGTLPLSDAFCRNLIKAAPMHDLGKIAVDDAILRKPGRFTPEEFEKMKSHASKGADIVREILKDTDDEDFCRIAENVAHYHHERMDGSGYPEGLCGSAIPLEARIMAVADVYDALVSRRVYKDAFSFEEADRIILEGMGSQFDPALEPYYRQSRQRLENYYARQDR